MIQANELRIGNYFYDNEKNILQCNGVADVEHNPATVWFGDELGFYMDIDECFPIPLTPEMLLKCGFEFDNCSFFKQLTKGRILKLNQNFYRDATGNYDGFILRLGDLKIIVIRHLHQLQNVFFAIADEDLPIENL